MERPASRPAVDGRRLAGRRGQRPRAGRASWCFGPRRASRRPVSCAPSSTSLPPARRADAWLWKRTHRGGLFIRRGRAMPSGSSPRFPRRERRSPMSAPGTIFGDPKGRRARRARDLVRSPAERITDGYLGVTYRGISIPARWPMTRDRDHAERRHRGQGFAGGAACGAGAPRRPGLRRAAIAAPCLLLVLVASDGCDGEVARLQLPRTPCVGSVRRRRWTNLVHVAVFLALPIHLHLESFADATVIPAGTRAAGRGLLQPWRPCGGAPAPAVTNHRGPVRPRLRAYRHAATSILRSCLPSPRAPRLEVVPCGPRRGGSARLLGHACGCSRGVGDANGSRWRPRYSGTVVFVSSAALRHRPRGSAHSSLATAGESRGSSDRRRSLTVLNALGWKWAPIPGRPQPCRSGASSLWRGRRRRDFQKLPDAEVARSRGRLRPDGRC